MSNLKAQLRSKKLMFAMILFLASIVFVATGQADFGQWSEFVKWVFGIYAYFKKYISQKYNFNEE